MKQCFMALEDVESSPSQTKRVSHFSAAARTSKNFPALTELINSSSHSLSLY